jgi:hypothetical protein
MTAGNDYFTLPEAVEYFKRCLAIQAMYPFPVSHETHRGRILYSPWTALGVIKEVPDLTFTLDLSHWIVVAERLIDVETLMPVLTRTKRILG